MTDKLIKDNSERPLYINMPEQIRGIIFDIDSTLYRNSEYAFEQIDVQIREFAKERSIQPEEARQLVAEKRRAWAESHSGQKISLANVMVSLGVPVSKSIEWRRSLINPADFLSPDELLCKAVSLLEQKYKIICVTNNPVSTGTRTLEALNLFQFFFENPNGMGLIGLDTCGVSKPAPEPFELAFKELGVKPENCISVGDRYDIDLAYPLSAGAGGILVNGPEDVIKMTEMLTGTKL